MKKIYVVLFVVLLLAGCSSKNPELTLRQNTESNMVQHLTEVRLSNLDYAAMQRVYEDYRTKMDFTVWNGYFDLSIGAVQYDTQVAETFNLVPKSYKTDYITSEVTDEGSVYILATTMVAVPTGTDPSDSSRDRNIHVYFMYTFNEEGVLTEYIQDIKLGDRRGSDV